MDDTAAHLVDHVLPDVPLRQWVLTFPFAWRIALAGRATLLGACIRVFDEEVRRHLRALHAPPAVRAPKRRTRDGAGRFADVDGRAPSRRVQGGALMATQRYGGSLDLDPHVHMLALDGVYVFDEHTARFVTASAPWPVAVETVLRRIVARCARLAVSAGLAVATVDPNDTREPERPALETCRAIGVQRGTSEIGEHEGGTAAGALDERAFRRGGTSRWSAAVAGFTLHAGITVAAGDRVLRERLCRYVVRPAFALGRLELRDDGRVACRCKESGRQRWRVMEPVEFLARLAALVPPPRYPELPYSGVLAPNAKWRPVVVPTAARERTRARRCRERTEKTGASEGPVAVRIDAVPWAELLRRVHGVDALGCARCGDGCG